MPPQEMNYGTPVTGPQYGPDQTLGPEDLNLPNLSLTDRYYLAGLAYMQNPNSREAQQNYENWYNAMGGQGGPPAGATAPGGAPPPAAPAAPAAGPNWQSSWDPAGFMANADPFWQLRHQNEITDYVRNMASGEGGGGLSFSGSSAASAPGYTAPQNYNPANAYSVWGQYDASLTPPPAALNAPAPATYQTPGRAQARNQFLRESGVGPRPQAPQGAAQPPGYGTPYEQIYRGRNPAEWGAWDAGQAARNTYDTALTNWKTEANRFLPDFRAQNPWTPPPQSLG